MSIIGIPQNYPESACCCRCHGARARGEESGGSRFIVVLLLRVINSSPYPCCPCPLHLPSSAQATQGPHGVVMLRLLKSWHEGVNRFVSISSYPLRTLVGHAVDGVGGLWCCGAAVLCMVNGGVDQVWTLFSALKQVGYLVLPFSYSPSSPYCRPRATKRPSGVVVVCVVVGGGETVWKMGYHPPAARHPLPSRMPAVPPSPLSLP
ncbi:hypothetical protein K504DRAFT_81788 [Pleomassaria siparia CBS 279.74]|uniref:Uncharacterized protein n=1 Tax=Pleomassaria siparia CBS 279.74 TaxID=1314801 RepID=A0A6G1K1Y3_9PLEO|nr:hypothetical protein K504DRAFT_81788 [Pleomassaria siparia CBS 279.74]